MFRKEPHFEAFERVIVETHERRPLRILSYCVLSNHWRFVVFLEVRPRIKCSRRQEVTSRRSGTKHSPKEFGPRPDRLEA